MGRNSKRERNPNKLPPQIDREVVHIGQLARALGWSLARLRSADDILKPIRLSDGTRVCNIDRAMAFIKVFDDWESTRDVREARARRNERRSAARNLPLVRREVIAADPAGLLRIGA